ncbi:guanine nucleotide exchange factor MSS4-like [Tubulanus polymorphus]|uniref:guanine nucleotide exchange factor MSS4-like n=1 Tax=Tubulanus polymorphus TaxID=672921 RepID=UPI003DA5FC8F
MADSSGAEQNLDHQVSQKHADFINDGTNVTKLLCTLCGSTVLLAKKAEYIQKQISLPHMKQKKDSADGDKTEFEELCHYWLVHDMYTFENVGFTKNVGTIKYLTCADCEMGPIGLMDTEKQTDFYIALDRVNHVP